MRHFWSDRKGNVAVLFAFAIVPVIGGVGAALDYSLANSYRTDMQKALDATALALSKIMPANQQTLDAAAAKYFQSNMGPNSLQNLTLVVTPQTGQVKVSVTADYAPKMVNLLGVSSFQIGTSATAKWGIGKVEVALVLDNSGSMGSLNRMTNLKLAAHDLLTVLEDAATTPGDAKVAIVPFDSAVRVPYTQANAPNWVKWGTSGSCSVGSSWWYNTSTQSGCHSAGGVWTWGSWSSKPWSSWAGCLEDRDKDPSPVDADVLDTAPTAGTNTTARRTQYPARYCDSTSLSTVLPLTTNWGTSTSTDATTLHGKINQMQPSGYTNIGIGVVWGWHVLSPTDLYTEGVAYGTPNLTKYIVLMTDGDNTRNRYATCSIWGGSCTEIDTRTQLACTNAKNAGVKIYTIRLIEGNAALLQNCATNINMYYEVQDASQLSDVFKGIASQIASLHLAK